MKYDYSDILLTNRQTPVEFWTKEDHEEFDRLSTEMKNEVALFIEEQKQFRHPDSHRDWYETETDKIRKKYIDKQNDILNKINLFEANELQIVLNSFGSKYSLDDARVFLVVKEFMRTYIINSRLQRQLTSHSLIDTIETENGSYQKPAVLLQQKLAYSMLYIKTIAELDRMTKEDKVVAAIEGTESRVLQNILNRTSPRQMKIIDLTPLEQPKE